MNQYAENYFFGFGLPAGGHWVIEIRHRVPFDKQLAYWLGIDDSAEMPVDDFGNRFLVLGVYLCNDEIMYVVCEGRCRSRTRGHAYKAICLMQTSAESLECIEEWLADR